MEWDKLPEESAVQYLAFCNYRDMGTGRSLSKLAEHYKLQAHNANGTHSAARPHAKSTLDRWCGVFAWVKRTQAWDLHLQNERDLETDTRRRQIMQDEYEDYLKLLDAYRQMSQRVPALMFKQDVIDKDKIVHIPGLNIGEIHELAKLRLTIASLGRLSQGLPDRIKEAPVSDEATPMRINRIEIARPTLSANNDDDAPKEKQA